MSRASAFVLVAALLAMAALIGGCARVPSFGSEALPEPPDTQADDEPSLKPYAVVNVPVTDLGDGPNSNHGKNTVTQGRMGDVLAVLEERDGWYRVEMYDGYEGWADPEDIVLYDQEAYDAYFGGAVVVVTSKTTPIMRPANDGVPLIGLELVQGSVLPTSGERDGYSVVLLPDGREGLISTGAAMKFERKEDVFAEKKDAEAVIDTALQYVGLPYLWGGTTAYGFDCSGLTQFAYRMNGYNIRRDANMQYEQGQPIDDIGDLQPGDLVFFETYAAGASHVGIYIGDSQYVQAGGSTGLTVQSFDPADPTYSEYLRNAYIGARRIIGCVD